MRKYQYLYNKELFTIFVHLLDKINNHAFITFSEYIPDCTDNGWSQLIRNLLLQ